MAEQMEILERRLEGLRTEVRRAAMAGDRAKANQLRAELRRVEDEWDANLLAAAGPDVSAVEDTFAPAAIIPVREQVHQALTFLGVPAAPKLIATVHAALFAGSLAGSQLASLRRDEERSFKAAPHARPYYLCAVLTADRLSPARGLLGVSTWSMKDRIVGPLSPRVHFLRSAIRIAEHLRQPEWYTLPARRLLWEFASNIPGGATSMSSTMPDLVCRAAAKELEVHEDADRSTREAAARRAMTMNDQEQLFGTTFGLAASSATSGSD